MKSSEDALALIVTEEDSDKAYYERHYEHFDWPAGASGPTVAIGYDCGYVTPAELRADWTGIVPDTMIEAMVPACGLRGEAAHAFVQAHKGEVTIPWDPAIQEFREREMPKWERHVDANLPNTDLLSGTSYGAIVSLAYNRGAGGFNAPGARFAEMRAIHAHMQAKEFDKIPAEFLSMRRLWPKDGDLWKRRGHEAALFEKGLQAPAPEPIGKPEPAVPVAPARDIRWLQTALNRLGYGPFPIDGSYSPVTRQMVERFQADEGLTQDGYGPITEKAIADLIDKLENPQRPLGGTA